MGRVHLEALRRLEYVEAVAVAGRTAAAAEKLGAGFSIPLATDDWRAVLRDKAIDAVHVCTPNGLHFEMAKEAVAAGKHVMCEKPLATTVAEAEELVALAKRQGVRQGVCHNIRFYPMVQQTRALREAGELGDILVVQGSYFQDWLLYETDWNWRVDSKAGGGSRVYGGHGFALVRFGRIFGRTCGSPHFARICKHSTPSARSRSRPSRLSPISCSVRMITSKRRWTLRISGR